MSLDFRTINTLWASLLVETLARLGVTTAIVCPGSRSTPLTIAVAHHPTIEAIPVLDERSAAFFALGVARRTHRPVVLICTSGTAGANFYPAVIEARESRVPLLVLTADRPPELRNCNAGQAIDQQKLFGSYSNFFSELALPSLDLLDYARQTIRQAWQQTLYPLPGVVHLNVPFREPLAPPIATDSTFSDRVSEDFFDSIAPQSFEFAPSIAIERRLSQAVSDSQSGVIIAGVAQPECPEAYCRAIAALAQTLGMPVLAEGLSPVRNYAHLNPNLVSTYDLMLRNLTLAEKLKPDVVIRIGEMPTSKQLRQWLTTSIPRQIVIDPSDRSLDPLHGKTIHLPAAIESIRLTSSPTQSMHLPLWLTLDAEIRSAIADTFTTQTELFEGKTAWLLSQVLPEKTPIFISNSMPVRDVEFFWQPNDRAIQLFFNRGANGIDGTLSTALGVAHHQQAILLTGDLALLHDTNGFLMRDRFRGHLTIVLINNNGGGIFSMLPIADHEPLFEDYFATPQNIDFSQLCQTYGIEYEQIHTWDDLTKRLNPLPRSGIRLLELKTDRHQDTQWRKNNLGRFANQL